MQEALADRNGALPQEQRIELRAGINLGDVVIDGDDIHGDGVNVAARLEEIAEPGGVCVSGMVYEGVRDRIETPFEDLGEQEVATDCPDDQLWSPAYMNAMPTSNTLRLLMWSPRIFEYIYVGSVSLASLHYL